MRWFTCTPVPFGGGPDFFARDSGLLSRGFRQIGIDSMAVMPGTRKPEDEADLIRTDHRNLVDPGWWKGHRLDGVVLYAWGKPGFRKVAQAIRDSGTTLVLNQDSSGIISPLCGLRAWMNEQCTLAGGGTSFQGSAAAVVNILKGLSLGLVRTDPLRAVHLKYGHFIAALHPSAVENYTRLCRIYGGEALARRVVLVPHAVAPHLTYGESSPPKQRRVIAIGRWDDSVQKRPALLTEVIGRLLSEDTDLDADIVGKRTEQIDAWHSSLPAAIARRVLIHGKLMHSEIQNLLSRASVYYCPSAYESFNIAAAEALCCGCSVVSADTATMASFGWFASGHSGTLAQTDDTDGHLDALKSELALWRDGGRNPADISKKWTGILHADKVAASVIALAKHTQ